MTFTTHEFDEIPDQNKNPLMEKVRKPKSPSGLNWYAIFTDGEVLESKNLKDLKHTLCKPGAMGRTIFCIIKGKKFVPKMTTTLDIVKG